MVLIVVFMVILILGFVLFNVVFDVFIFSDVDFDLFMYSWVFGDGNIGMGEIISYIYVVDGIYNVIFIVSDG